MKLNAKKYQYAVVHFLQRPCENIDEFVCIPHSWIRERGATEEQSKVAYPNERPSVTQRRIEDGEQPSEKWVPYLAVIRYETYTYEDAQFYILEKKYGVAAEDLGTSTGNRKNTPIKRLRASESQCKLTVEERTDGGSAPNKISEENTSNAPTKNQAFVYPYLQQIPDYCEDSKTNGGSSPNKISEENTSIAPTKNQAYVYPYLQQIPDYSKDSTENDCEDIERKPCHISRDFLNSMKQHLLISSNQNQVINTNHNIEILKVSEVDKDNPLVLPTEKVSEESSEVEPHQVSHGSQDSEIQPMIDEPEENEDTMEVSSARDDDSDRSSSPGESTEETDQPVDYPTDKIRTQANFIARFIEKIEKGDSHSSEKLLEVHKSFERSQELVKSNRNSVSSKKLELNKEKQDEAETLDVELKNDVKSSSNGDEDDCEDKDEKAPKKPRNLRNFVLPLDHDPNDTRWTLKYRENDLGLEELLPGSKVFINSIRLAHCLRVSKDCKTLARMLLAEIFSQSALAVCSLTGAKANAFHNNGTYVRPGLDKNARVTMLTYVERQTRKKKWTTYDHQSVINSLRSKVQEIREKHART